MAIIQRVALVARAALSSLGLLCILSLPGLSHAQVLTTPPPIHSPVDANGVDLGTGNFTVAVPGFSIGAKGQHGLRYSRQFIQSGWTDSTVSSITIVGSTYTVSFGGTSESFTGPSGGPFTPAQGQGSSLSFNSATSQYTYTAAEGTVTVFGFFQGLAGYGSYRALSSTNPSGVITTYNYQGTNICLFMQGNTCVTRRFFERLDQIVNNLGWELILSYASNSVSQGDMTSFNRLTNVTPINLAVDNCYNVFLCTGLSTTYPTSTLTPITGPPAGLTDTDALGRVTTYTYNTNGTIASIKKPSGLTITVTYNASNQVASVSNGTGTWTYGYSSNSTTETTTVTDPLNHVRTVVVNLSTDEIASDEDALSRTTSYIYDSFGRPTQVTYPRGDELQYGYDSRGNMTSVTHVPAPGVPVAGSGFSSVVASASYDATCSNPVKCNRPNSTTDQNGKITSYTYDPTYGVLTKVDPPLAVAGGTQSETRYSYTQLFAEFYNAAGTGTMAQSPSAVHELTGVSTCQTQAPSTCPGSSDEVKSTIVYGTVGAANNLLPTSISTGSGNGSLTATTSTTYTTDGDVATTVGPLGAGQKTVYTYDFDREAIGVFGPEASSTTGYPTTRTTHNSDGLVTKVENGSDTNQNDATFATFSSLEQHNTIYDSLDRAAQHTLTSGGVTYNVTQNTYDNANRLTCTAVRMNPAVFGSLPSSACALGTQGSNGNDRVTQDTYDNADELAQVTVALGDAAQANYARYTYTANGKIATVEDANNNLTSNTYDGLDRLQQTNYPSTTKGAGVSDSSNYEAYTYDLNGNRVTVRRRSSDTISYMYDALNRLIEKVVPTWSGQNVFYSYDLLNRQTSANYGSPTGAGASYAYDALSRKTGETAGGRTISSQYDLAGDRTQITWPDSFYVNYVYDVLQRATKVEEEGAVSGVGLLATYTYDSLGRLTAVTRGNGANTSIGYDGADRIATLAHSFINTAANVSWTFTYDAANGILSRTATNDSYTSHPGALNLSYVANGLNQYSSVGGATYSYDGRGDLASDGTRTFTFDVDNRLLTGSAPTAATYTYDPLGRMQTDTASATTTTFLYDGDNLSAEFNSAGAVLRRYVPSGLGLDKPLVWYEGASTASRRWLHADNQSSIVAYSDSSGDQGASYGYGPYGEPGSWAGGSRYAYTGQLMISENSLYNYKARAYDPQLGRFLQTDPSGYGSDVNFYAYARGNTPNIGDPMGLGGNFAPGSICGGPCGTALSPPIVVPPLRATNTSGGLRAQVWSNPDLDSFGAQHPIPGTSSPCAILAHNVANSQGALPSNITNTDQWNSVPDLEFNLQQYESDLQEDEALETISGTTPSVLAGVGAVANAGARYQSIASIVATRGWTALEGLSLAGEGLVGAVALPIINQIAEKDSALRAKEINAINARLQQLEGQRGGCPSS